MAQRVMYVQAHMFPNRNPLQTGNVQSSTSESDLQVVNEAEARRAHAAKV